MRLTDFHPIYAERFQLADQRSSASSLWQEEWKSLFLDQDFLTVGEALSVLHKAERIHKVFLAGLENDAAFRDAYDHVHPALWEDYTSPPVEEALQQGLAAYLYNIDSAKNDKAILQIANGARRVGEIVLEKCLHNHIPVIVRIIEGDFFDLILNHTNDKGIKSLAEDYVELAALATKMITAGSGGEESLIKSDPEKDIKYREFLAPHTQRIRSGDIFYTITEIPTRRTAALDEMEYEDYIKLFFEMCDQPWDYIGMAQEKLIGELNVAKTLRFTNDDGTDITLGIKGFTFCNSLIGKNVPGSEVFSAPERNNVNGRIVSKGRFSKGKIENLTMEFEQGCLVRWHADKGQEHFEEAIGIDEGACFVGEIGIGTNPHLRRHVVNGLLVEKVGGSFHIALGSSYKYTTYSGQPVVVDNGNVSKLHWDITTMLFGKGGCIYLDGRKIMDDGFFIDPVYDVFNRGWASVPIDERPPYWREMSNLSYAQRRGAPPAL